MIVEKMKSLIYSLCLFRQFWVLRYYDPSNPPLVYSKCSLGERFCWAQGVHGCRVSEMGVEDWCWLAILSSDVCILIPIFISVVQFSEILRTIGCSFLSILGSKNHQIWFFEKKSESKNDQFGLFQNIKENRIHSEFIRADPKVLSTWPRNIKL
jgi:hypothetical protein